MNDRENIVERIKETLREACEDNCQPCQQTTVEWLQDLGWVWLEVEGTKAKATFGFKITETRLQIFSRPGILSNCHSSSEELEAPTSPT